MKTNPSAMLIIVRLVPLLLKYSALSRIHRPVATMHGLAVSYVLSRNPHT